MNLTQVVWRGESSGQHVLRDAMVQLEPLDTVKVCDVVYVRTINGVSERVMDDPAPVRRSSCRNSCRAIAYQKWAGAWWSGIPAPKRWARHLMWCCGLIDYPYPEGGYPGCGCFVLLRSTWDSLRSGWINAKAIIRKAEAA